MTIRADTPARRPKRPRRSAARTARYGWLGVSAVASAYFFTYLTRYAIAVVVPDLMADLDAGAAAIALLASAYFWTYALAQLPTGVLADRIGPRRTLALGLVLSSLGVGLFAAAPSFSVGFVGRLANGLGVGVVYVCGAKLVANWFRERDFSPVIGVVVLTGSLGSLVSAAPFAALAGQTGWRAAFGVTALVLLLVALYGWWAVRDTPEELGLPRLDGTRGRGGERERGRDAEPQELLPLSSSPPHSLADGLRATLAHRTTWLLAGYAFGNFGTLAAMQGLWTVPFLRDVYGYSPADAALALTMWGVGLTPGPLLWGFVADRLLRRRKLTALVGGALYAPVWLVLALWPDQLPPLLLYGLFFWAGLTNTSWVPTYGQLRSLVPDRYAGTAMGVLNTAFFVGGATFQQVTGRVLDVYGSTPTGFTLDGYRAIFTLCLVASTSALALLVFTREVRVT